MVHDLFAQHPYSALWLYVFAVIILLVLSYIGVSVAGRKYDANGNKRMSGGLAALLIAIILGLVIWFILTSSNVKWAWLLSLLPVALLLFGIYFAVFMSLGKVMFFIAFLVALLISIWLIYFVAISGQFELLAFPIVFLVLIIVGGLGWGMWNKRVKQGPTSDILSEVGLSGNSMSSSNKSA